MMPDTFTGWNAHPAVDSARDGAVEAYSAVLRKAGGRSRSAPETQFIQAPQATVP